jgi:hypothetical protein
MKDVGGGLQYNTAPSIQFPPEPEVRSSSSKKGLHPRSSDIKPRKSNRDVRPRAASTAGLERIVLCCPKAANATELDGQRRAGLSYPQTRTGCHRVAPRVSCIVVLISS